MKKLIQVLSVFILTVLPLQAQCDLDFVFNNTGSNMTAFFTPPASTAIYSGLGDGQIGAFYLDDEGAYVCASSAVFTGAQMQLAVMGDDATTAEKDGFSSGEEINWFYKTNDGAVHSISLSPADDFVVNAISFIGGASTAIVDCGGGSNDECPELETAFINTGSNMTLFVTPDGAEDLSVLGDGVIAVYYDNAESLVCAGSSNFSSTSSQIAANGDDATTAEKDGFSSGEAIVWKFQDNAGNQYLLSPSPFDAFALNGISFVTGFSYQAISCASEVEGCTDDAYTEFNSNANIDDGTCLTLAVYGCTDLSYLEYNPEANVNDGSCSIIKLEGCMDVLYLEFNYNATIDDGSCLTLSVSGCSNPLYAEYNPEANVNDDSCLTLIVAGCTDALYVEYNSEANIDDGSCLIIAVYGCLDNLYLEYNELATIGTSPSSCLNLIVEGCTDANYTEFNSSANTDDGTCTTFVIYGCTDANATNFSSSANLNDGSCEYDLIGSDCAVSFETINTGSNHTIMVPASLNSPLSIGDQIGVFYISPSGSAVCAGSSVWTGDVLQIVAFGDDTTTDEVDGLPSGAPFLFIAKSGDQVYLVSTTFQTPSMSNYVVNGLSFVSGFEFELACSVEYLGCTDVTACNYDTSANTDDSSCEYPATNFDCNDDCLIDTDNDGVCDELEVLGCTDALSSNYNADATENNNSCISWQDAYNSCTNSGGDDGITQADVDAQADLSYGFGYDDGAASVVPEDGVSQADVDAQADLSYGFGYGDGAASVVPEDGVSQADVDAQADLSYSFGYGDGAASVVPEDGVSQADVDAQADLSYGFGYGDGAASVVPEDGVSQADVDLVLNELNSVNNQLLIAQSEAANLQAQLEDALTNSGSCEPIYVDLITGWNIIGYTLSFQQDVTATLADIVDDVQIVKNNSASVYWPEYGFNGIGYFIPGQGYQIRMFNQVDQYTFPDVDGQRVYLNPTVPSYVHELPILNHPNDIKSLVRVVNMLGQEIRVQEQAKGEIVLYLYNDGTTEKRY